MNQVLKSKEKVIETQRIETLPSNSNSQSTDKYDKNNSVFQRRKSITLQGNNSIYLGSNIENSNVQSSRRKSSFSRNSIQNIRTSKNKDLYDRAQSIIGDEMIFTESALDEDDRKDEIRIEKEFIEAYEKLKNEELDNFYVIRKSPFENMKYFYDSKPFLKIRRTIFFAYNLIAWVCGKIIRSYLFEAISLQIILWNSLMLAIENDTFEDIFTILYTTEMSLKILGMGFIMNKGAYLRDPWNIMDFIIVISSLIPFIIKSNSVNISVLRSFRILRPLRTISSIRNLRILLLTIFSAIPLLLETLMILFFFFLIFAIAGLQMFSGILKRRCFYPGSGIEYETKNYLCGYQVCPNGLICGKMIENPNWGFTNFDNIFYSLLNVFQCVTLEGWNEILVYVGKSFHFLTCIYFVVLVFIGAFFLLNLTLAVIKLKFTQSQIDKKINKNEIINKIHNKEIISITDLRIYKSKERIFLKKFFDKTYNSKSFGATIVLNAKISSSMLEFFDFATIIKSIIKGNPKSQSLEISDKFLINKLKNKTILKSLKPNCNKDSEILRSFKIKGKEFKGFTNLPVNTEERKSTKKKIINQDLSIELVEELDSFIKDGFESNPLTSRKSEKKYQKEIIPNLNNLENILRKEEISRETDNLLNQLEEQPELLINPILNSYRRFSSKNKIIYGTNKLLIQNQKFPETTSHPKTQIILNTSMNSNIDLIENRIPPQIYNHDIITSSENRQIKTVNLESKALGILNRKPISTQTVYDGLSEIKNSNYKFKSETEMEASKPSSIKLKLVQRNSISNIYKVRNSKNVKNNFKTLNGFNKMKASSEDEELKNIDLDFQEKKKMFYSKLSLNTTQRLEIQNEMYNNNNLQKLQNKARFYKFEIFQNNVYDSTSFNDVLDKL